mmetsp:Transcript_25433/g.83668  ORF Transcript_25433/g.83668 Transcript_25433/m.83668 type:complete len:239 (-) Transcript_25433:69-785(-)
MEAPALQNMEATSAYDCSASIKGTCGDISSTLRGEGVTDADVEKMGSFLQGGERLVAVWRFSSRHARAEAAGVACGDICSLCMLSLPLGGMPFLLCPFLCTHVYSDTRQYLHNQLYALSEGGVNSHFHLWEDPDSDFGHGDMRCCGQPVCKTSQAAGHIAQPAISIQGLKVHPQGGIINAIGLCCCCVRSPPHLELALADGSPLTGVVANSDMYQTFVQRQGKGKGFVVVTDEDPSEL